MHHSTLAFSAAFFSGALALAALFFGKRSIARWCFFFGMAVRAAESAMNGMSLEATRTNDVAYWLAGALIVKSLMPGLWLCFSLTYSRGNYQEFLTRWRFVLAASVLIPLALSVGFRDELLQVIENPDSARDWWIRFGAHAKALNVVLLITDVIVLMNLESTFRTSVGTMRWRIKFPILGLAVLFGVSIYSHSQALLFSGHQLGFIEVDSGALLIGCTLITIGYLRSGASDIDVYPSHTVLRTSLTVLLAGGYLFAIGVAAQIIALVGGAEDFQTKVLLVLLGIVVLAMLLLSDRLRQKIQRFVSRHLQRPQHDFRKVWTLFTQRVSNSTNSSGLSTSAAKLISETFDALSVTIWLVDERKDRLVLGASTALLEHEASATEKELATSGAILEGLRKRGDPFDLETITDEWGDSLREVCHVQFRKGGHRIGVPLLNGDRCLGFAILADRVNGLPYTVEEMDLLKCIGDQITAALLNLKLTEDLMDGKELEAFQTMSTFFVHDLKNAASSLGLMLQNLPVHFNDPEFREDALRGMGGTVGRINQLIERLGALRHKLELKPVESDLNQLVEESLKCLSGAQGVQFKTELHPLPQILADRELMKSVVTNLILNAVDAVGKTGEITVKTSQRDHLAILSVSDTGCGMSAEFLKNSLFRPFQTTKKKGLGIGMFQSKMITEAHRGTIQVESEPGKGTTFRVILPVQFAAS